MLKTFMFFSLITFFISFFFLETPPVYAETMLAQASASLSMPVIQTDKRAEVLKAFLEQYNSPFANEAETFIKHADEQNIDWRLLVAISGVESTFGQAYPQGTYNAWGWGIYGTNRHGFASWEDAIATISLGLRERYMDKWGAKNVYEIGSFYAASPTWASRVESFMAKISKFEESYTTTKLAISL